MKRGCFLWRGEPVAFGDGESIAIALTKAGMRDLSTGGDGGGSRYFCGIGACQNCLVVVDGAVVEACLTPASDGLDVAALGGRHE
ncbi:(2Fe-2S)-binding protein [Aquibium carbonis]|uniref:(2Fe-2S)-binding protein n=1 Tax=Aquibium carbonis TaxID=2495581 RepID=A0A429Z247_9HYPH|nr:2Fe-2S iron-sulfur cluster-binding protein [Aquibium carbonis]RST87773.1 (2Fe-2S)-binding protein [Aquibium carbonis]